MAASQDHRATPAHNLALPAWTFAVLLILVLGGALVCAWVGFRFSPGNPAPRFGIAIGGLLAGGLLGLGLWLLGLAAGEALVRRRRDPDRSGSARAAS
jgi:hypothetical protein